MKNKNVLYLLICLLITNNIDASNNDIDNNGYINKIKVNNNDLKIPHKVIIEDVNSNCRKVTVEKNKDGYLSIKNNNLNCSLISLINCLKTLYGSSDNLISRIRYRYNCLNEIQCAKQNYSINISDIICALYDFDNDIYLKLQCSNDHSLLQYKSKIIKHENIIADIIKSLVLQLEVPYDLNKNKRNIELTNEVKSKIESILDKINTIHKDINNIINNNDITLIKNVLQANNDPIDTLNALIDTFNKQNIYSKSKLQVYTLCLDNNKKINLIEEKVKANDNFILNCGGLFINVNNSTNSEELNKFIDIISKNSLIKIPNTSLSAILVAFFDTTNNSVFHYASVINTSNDKWLFIDYDKQYNKNSEVTLYNSIYEIFNQDNLTTQNVPDELLIDSVPINKNCEINNIRNYKLIPVLLFYKKKGPNTGELSESHSFNPNDGSEINQYNNTINNILEFYKKQLKLLESNINKLQNDVNNIILKYKKEINNRNNNEKFITIFDNHKIKNNILDKYNYNIESNVLDKYNYNIENNVLDKYNSSNKIQLIKNGKELNNDEFSHLNKKTKRVNSHNTDNDELENNNINNKNKKAKKEDNDDIFEVSNYFDEISNPEELNDLNTELININTINSNKKCDYTFNNISYDDDDLYYDI